MKWRVRTIAVGVLGVLLIAVFCVILCQWRSTSAITLDNYNRIQIGMTRDQVEELLGPPRWDVKRRDPAWFDVACVSTNVFMLPKEWWGPEGVIQIWYLGEGRVVSEKNFTNHRCEVRPITLIDKLEEWLEKHPVIKH